MAMSWNHWGEAGVPGEVLDAAKKAGVSMVGLLKFILEHKADFAAILQLLLALVAEKKGAK